MRFDGLLVAEHEKLGVRVADERKRRAGNCNGRTMIAAHRVQRYPDPRAHIFAF